MDHGLFFAGEDSHAEGGDSHEGRSRGDHIIGTGGGVLLGLGLGGVLGGGDDDDGAAGCGLNEAVTNYRVFIANLAPIIIGHGHFHAFRQGPSGNNLTVRLAAVDGGIIANGDGGTLTNIIKAYDTVADILKGIAGDDNIAVVASTLEILNGNGIVAGCIKSTALYRDIFDMACINALAAAVKFAVFNSQVGQIAIVVLVVITQCNIITVIVGVSDIECAVLEGKAVDGSFRD